MNSLVLNILSASLVRRQLALNEIFFSDDDRRNGQEPEASLGY